MRGVGSGPWQCSLAVRLVRSLLLVLLLGIAGLLRAAPPGAAALASAVAPGGADAPIQALGQIGGFNGGVAARGDDIYLAEGPHLLVLDGKNPARLTIVGESALLPADADQVLLTGRYALVVYGNQPTNTTPGVAVVDVANAAQPTLVGAFAAPGVGKITALAAQGTTLYVGFQSYGLPTGGGIHIVSFAAASTPKELGVYATGAAAPAAAASAAGLLAYATPYAVRLLDVTDPAQPREVGDYQPPPAPAGTVRTITDLAFAGPDLVATEAVRPYTGASGPAITNGGALRVVDVRDPAHPVVVGAYATADPAGPLALVGTRAYAAVGGQLAAFDLSNPAAPRLLGAFRAGANLTALAAMGHTVYLSLLNGLQVVDFATPAQPRQVGALTTVYGGERLALGGSLAYDVTADTLRLIDVADPRRPLPLGSLPLRQFAQDVAAVGRTAYVLDAAGLRIVDASDSQRPVEIGRYATGAPWTGVAASPPYVYLVGGSGLEVVDVANPAVPVLVGRLPLAGDQVAVAGRRAYVSAPLNATSNDSRIDIVALADPCCPAAAGSFTVTGAVSGLAAAGDGVYVAVESVAPGLAIYAVPRGKPPRRLAMVDAGVETTSVALDGHYAYLGGGGGLTAVDVTNPAQPRLIGRLATGYSLAVAGANGIAYASAGSRGLWLAQVDASLPSPGGPSGPCRFVLGFAALHAALPSAVGACLDNEQHAANGDAVQHTTGGLLVWRKHPQAGTRNVTAFTDGYHT